MVATFPVPIALHDNDSQFMSTTESNRRRRVVLHVPDGFVSNNDLGPFLLLQLFGHGTKLSGHNVDSLVGFTFL